MAKQPILYILNLRFFFEGQMLIPYSKSMSNIERKELRDVDIGEVGPESSAVMTRDGVRGTARTYFRFLLFSFVFLYIILTFE